MTSESTGLHRYHPVFHNDPDQYIDLSEGEKDRNLRRNLVLGGLFTPLCELLYDRFIAFKEQHGLFLPDKLSGEEPRRFPYRHTIAENTVFLTFPVSRFKQGYASKEHVFNDTRERPSLRIYIPIGKYGPH